MRVLVFVAAIANLICASLGVYSKNYGMATFNFGVFILCMFTWLKAIDRN